MKKLFTIACTLVLGCAMSFAQAGTQTPPAGSDTTKTTKSDTTKTKKHSHGKKGAKKSKKGTGDTTTTPPK